MATKLPNQISCYSVLNWKDARAKATNVPEEVRAELFEKCEKKASTEIGNTDAKLVIAIFTREDGKAVLYSVHATANFQLLEDTFWDFENLARDHIVALVVEMFADGTGKRSFCCFMPKAGCTRFRGCCCKRCGSVEGLLACSKCHVFKYCGRDCQRADWPTHRPLCTMLADIKDEVWPGIGAAAKRLKCAKEAGIVSEALQKRLEALPGWTWDYAKDATMQLFASDQRMLQAYSFMSVKDMEDRIRGIEAFYAKYGFIFDSSKGPLPTEHKDVPMPPWLQHVK